MVLQEYPFWYLQSDGFWKVMDVDHLRRKKGKDIPLRTEFDKYDPVGILREDIEEQLRADPQLVSDAARLILQRNFPSSIHAEIALEVGLVISDEVRAVRKKRDPAFRGKILRAYGHRCAVCSFDLRFGYSDLALEAAHIKWHQVGGPDIESNGLALCSMHHKMLDRGAFTVSNEYQIIVSQEVCGSAGLVEYLLRFHGQLLRKPQSQEYVPDPRYIRWHQQQVFRNPGRQL